MLSSSSPVCCLPLPHSLASLSLERSTKVGRTRCHTIAIPAYKRPKRFFPRRNWISQHSDISSLLRLLDPVLFYQIRMPCLSFLTSVSLVYVLIGFGSAASIPKPLSHLVHRSAESDLIPKLKASQMKSLGQIMLGKRTERSTNAFSRYLTEGKIIMSHLANEFRQRTKKISAVSERKLSTRQASIEEGTYDQCAISGPTAQGTLLAAELIADCLPCLSSGDDCPSTCCGNLLGTEPEADVSTSSQALLCKLESW